MGKLTAKKDAFCQEYIIDLNATQAAIRAGYSEKTAKSQGQRLLTNVDIQNRVCELKKQRLERTKIDADYVLNRLVEIDEMDAADILDDAGDLLPVKQWPMAWRRTISGLDIANICDEMLVKKIKWPDKLKNLELLGKHVDVQAFKEKIEHDGEIKNSAPVINLTLTDTSNGSN